jgi:hypothetical protein
MLFGSWQNQLLGAEIKELVQVFWRKESGASQLVGILFRFSTYLYVMHGRGLLYKRSGCSISKNGLGLCITPVLAGALNK